MKPAVRISLGLVALTATLVLVTDMALGIFPDPRDPLIEERTTLCESLAVQYSALVNQSRAHVLEGAMRATAAQLDEVLSIGLRAAEGTLMATTPEHDAQWLDAADAGSTATHVRVPIFSEGERWGTVEVAFAPLDTGGPLGFLRTPLYQLLLIVGSAGFAVYMLYLRRTLRYLDPSTVVPGRVRAALDQLVEGVILLDADQRIVLANTAFADKVGSTPDALLGADPSSLGWSAEGQRSELPWAAVLRDGSRREDVRLELESPTQGRRVLTSNVSAIVDGRGSNRGVLASFDDISDSERMNRELQEAVTRLETAQGEVRRQNDELTRLVSIDPLTEALNRRALFEKLELELDVARRDGLELCVVMADIDHFKSINDTFGHGVGDAVIRAMADVLRELSGANGFVGRYGGEEFCVVLVDTGVARAWEIADRTRIAFSERLGQPDTPTPGRAVTASFGLSALRFGAADLAELLDQADQALYASKSGGRNRVTVFADLKPVQREAS